MTDIKIKFGDVHMDDHFDTGYPDHLPLEDCRYCGAKRGEYHKDDCAVVEYESCEDLYLIKANLTGNTPSPFGTVRPEAFLYFYDKSFCDGFYENIQFDVDFGLEINPPVLVKERVEVPRGYHRIAWVVQLWLQDKNIQPAAHMLADLIAMESLPEPERLIWSRLGKWYE